MGECPSVGKASQAVRRSELGDAVTVTTEDVGEENGEHQYGEQDDRGRITKLAGGALHVAEMRRALVVRLISEAAQLTERRERLRVDLASHACGGLEMT